MYTAHYKMHTTLDLLIYLILIFQKFWWNTQSAIYKRLLLEVKTLTVKEFLLFLEILFPNNLGFLLQKVGVTFCEHFNFLAQAVLEGSGKI